MAFRIKYLWMVKCEECQLRYMDQAYESMDRMFYTLFEAKCDRCGTRNLRLVALDKVRGKK